MIFTFIGSIYNKNKYLHEIYNSINKKDNKVKFFDLFNDNFIKTRFGDD
jgi:hypothetical protein